MKKKGITLVIYSFIISFVTGCSVSSPELLFGEIQNSVQERTNITISWDRDKESKDEIAKRIENLLENPLTAETAAEIALLNNKRIQATYETLGIARAELVQAGLLKNPLLELRSRFPSSGSGTNFELGISEPIFDVFFIPLRTRIAEDKLAFAKATIAHEVIESMMDTKKAFYELQSAQQLLETRVSILNATEAAFTSSQKIFEAGNTAELKVSSDKALYEEAKLEKLDAESEVEEKTETLASLMGLEGSERFFKISSHLKFPPKESLNTQNLIELALSKNMELASSRLAIEELGKELGLSTPMLFSDGEFGVSAERDLDGSWVTGPNLLIPIPIFDQGQGYHESIHSQFRELSAKYQSMVIEKKAKIRAAFTKMEKSRAKAKVYRDSILPLRTHITEETQTRYNAMLVGVFDLLLAKQSEIQAGANYIQVLKDYWEMRTELEREVGVQFNVPADELSHHEVKAKPASEHHMH